MLKRVKSLLFENKSSRQTVAKNTFWLSVSQIGSRLIRALIMIYAARVLGAAEYGVFSYALSLAGFFTVFADTGISSILTREASKDMSRRSNFFATAFWIKSALLLVSVTALLLIAPHVSNMAEANVLLPIIGILVIMDGLRELGTAFFRAVQKMELEALVTTLTNVGIAVFGFIILYYSATAESLAISYVASSALGTLAAIFILKSEFIRVLSHFRRELVKPLIQAILPLAAFNLLGVFMLNTDTVIIGWYLNSAEIGYYSAAQRIIQVLYAFPGVLASSIFPLMAKAVHDGDHKKSRTLAEYGMVSVLAIALPMVAGGLLLAKPIMLFLYGAEYLPGTLSFQLLLVTLLILFPGLVLSNYNVAHDAQKRAIPAFVLGAASNVVLDIVLIPKFGIAGSAIATIIAQGLNFGYIYLLMKKINSFSIFQYFKKISLSVFVMVLTIYLLSLLRVHVLINIGLSGVVYITSLYLLKENLLSEVRKALRGS